MSWKDRSSIGSMVSQPRVFSTGEALLVPADTVHAVTNVGTGTAAELATYVVEKGKPLVVVVD